MARALIILGLLALVGIGLLLWLLGRVLSWLWCWWKVQRP